MTDQEAFDKMVNHLPTLKERSTNSSGYCIYGGSKCVVGSLLTDYEKDNFGYIEGDVDELLGDMFKVGHNTPLSKVNLHMLQQMQALHDDETLWDEDGFDGWGLVTFAADKYDLAFNDPRKVQNDG